MGIGVEETEGMANRRRRVGVLQWGPVSRRVDDVGGGQVSGSGGARRPAAGRVQAEREKEFGAARDRLEAERKRIQAEISSYPAPIAGCDEQFNYLLERRSQVQRELARLVEEESLRRGAQRGDRM